MAIAANLVNPLLVFCVLVAPRLARRPSWPFWLRTAAGVAPVYLLTLADRGLGLWKVAGMDFSTHTAVAVALLVSLAALDRRWLWLGGPLLAAYAVIMVRLAYHSPAEIVTSAAVAAAAAAPLAWWTATAGRGRRSRTGPSQA